MIGVVAAALALGAPVFGSPQPVARVAWNGGYLDEIAVADFNGDGISDIVGVSQLVEQTTHPIVVLAGNGRGGFADVTNSIFDGAVPRVQHARQIVLADFNRDGRTDIFIADHGYDKPPFPGHQNTLVLSAPGGKLADATANLPQQSDFTHSAASADVNGDGAPDLFVGNLGSTTVPPPAILLDDGTGHFHVLPDALPGFITSDLPTDRFTRETFADVNGDGAPDLVLLQEGGLSFTGLPWAPSLVLLNDGRGHFSVSPGGLPPPPDPVYDEGLAIVPVDLNGDGKVDLLAAYSRLGGPSESFYVGRYVQVLINNGDGTFRDETAARLPQNSNNTLSWAYAIRVGDLNGDGKPDFMLSLDGFDGANEPPPVYLNNGDGTFKQISVPGLHQLTDFADVNRDGRLDIVSVAPAPNESATDDYYVSLQQQPVKPKPKPKKKPRRHHP